jgi:[acyl-carrier-protein] S-malonyltransferase
MAEIRNDLAFVFPGQGSQSVGMLADLADSYPVVHDTFRQASEVLGYDLWRLVQDGPTELLNETERTQPAMLAAGVAVWRLWLESGGPVPGVVAGHSLGEYSALVAAGAIEFPIAVDLVAARGRFMQQAVAAGEGAMAAILNLSDDDVRQLCADEAKGDVLEPVNFNSPGQVVIAGNTAAVERAVAAAPGRGARKALRLPVSVPSHCSLMRPAAEHLADALTQVAFHPPRITVLHNADVASHDEPDRIRQLLVEQLYRPVRWVETVECMVSDGVTTIIEAGPGKVLAGLNKRISKGATTVPLFDASGVLKALDQLGGGEA